MTSSNDGSESNISYCTSCGEEISNGVKFCPGCGANQETEQGTEEEQATATATAESTDASGKGKSGLRHKLPGVSKSNTTRRNVIFGAGYTVLGLSVIGAAAGPEENTSADGGTNGGDGGTNGGDGGGSESYPSAFYYSESTGLVVEDDIDAELDSIGSLYIRGTVRNESNQNYEYVQITWSVLDSSGAKIADALANTSGLEAGQSWRYEALATSADEVDSYELQDITAY